MAIMMHYSTSMAAQRRKDRMDTAERSVIAKGIPKGTFLSSCFYGEGQKSNTATLGLCCAHHSLDRDFLNLPNVRNKHLSTALFKGEKNAKKK